MSKNMIPNAKIKKYKSQRSRSQSESRDQKKLQVPISQEHNPKGQD